MSDSGTPRITRVTHQLIRVPFTETIAWGSGKRTGTTRLVCCVDTDDPAISGWGETLCLLDAVPAVFEQVVAKLAVGLAISDVETLYRHTLGSGYYHHKRAAVMAIAALEMAMWDARGKHSQLPLYAMWGGRWRKSVPAAAYTFTARPDQLSNRLKQFRDRGFTTFKVKIGYDEKSDIALAEAARHAIGDHALRLDVNGAWTPGTARRQLEKLKGVDPVYVEQPLEMDDLQGSALLRQSQPVPIALDESAYTLQDTANILRVDAADYLLLDPHQCGGLWQVIKAAAIAEGHGIAVGLHSGAELGLSQAAYVHLAAAIANMSLAIDTERDYLSDDIAFNAPVLREGAFVVPEAPGLGVTVDPAQLERYRVDRITGAYLDDSRPGWFPIKPAY